MTTPPTNQNRIGMQISVKPWQRAEIRRLAAEAGKTMTEWLLDGRLKTMPQSGEERK